MTKKQIKEFEAKYNHVFLDPEISPPEDQDFYLLTTQEIKSIKKKTQKRMKEYNQIKPRDEAGY